MPPMVRSAMVRVSPSDRVTLTDELSASASEIFAGAVQDYGRGLVVGSESTHGKGTVQHIVSMADVINKKEYAPHAGALKLTLKMLKHSNEF